MKQLIVAVVLSLIATSSFADGRRDQWHDRDRGGHSGHQWVSPLIIGGVVGYVLSRPSRQEYAPPVIYREPQCERVVFYDSYGNFIREEQRCN